MKDFKLTKHAWMLWGIALIVVIVLMSAIPFHRTATWWLAAACNVLMFGLCAVTFYAAFRREGCVESKLLGWPIFRVSLLAVCAQLLLGLALMIGSGCPMWIAAILEMLLFAATGACLTIKDAMRQGVTASEQAARDSTAPFKAIRAKAAALAGTLEDPEAQAAMRKLAENLRYADPVCDEQTAELDEQLAQGLDNLPEEPSEQLEAIAALTDLLSRRRAIRRASHAG